MGCASSTIAEEAKSSAGAGASKKPVDATPQKKAQDPGRPEPAAAAAVHADGNGSAAAANFKHVPPPPVEPARPKPPPQAAPPPVQPAAPPPQQQSSASQHSLEQHPQGRSKKMDPTSHEDGQEGAKKRRAAGGGEAMLDQLRKLAVGQAPEDKGKMYQVSDSEDEDLDEGLGNGSALGWSKPQEIADAICEALKRNFVFKGIPEGLLLEVVERMYGVCFRAGSTVLQQGAVPKADDCMYYLQSGEADVVISGAVDSSKTNYGEDRKVEGHTVRISQKPGWVFGDVALLFNSSRTASVMAKTNITVWALERKTFLMFVMKHAQGARALRFLRKLPLLKGLSDNDLIRAASRMPQRVYQDGQALIKIGERGDEMYLVRYGKVRVLRPVENGARAEVAVLGRGQFVGERAVINNKLRSADCVAQGTVQVVVMKKRDFLDLDNPLLAWMLDYDAVATVLKSIPMFKSFKQDQLESLLDRFDAREELHQGDVIVQQGDMVEKLYVIKLGEVCLMKGQEEVKDPNFARDVGGFTCFGDAALQGAFKSGYTVVVASETLHMICLPKRNLDLFLGKGAPGLASQEQVLAALKKSQFLANVPENQLKEILAVSEETCYNAGAVIATTNSAVTNKIFLVKSGEVLLAAADAAVPGQGEADLKKLAGSERGRLGAGGLFNDKALSSPETASLEASLVAASACTVISFTTSDVEKVLGGRATAIARQASQNARPSEPPAASSSSAAPGGAVVPAGAKKLYSRINFHDLEMHRIIGTGQFGMVRVVRDRRTNEAYALKLMHKAPITETKQIEHVINERKILEEAGQHPFCVKLMGCYQDKQELYLLQEWVAGGELFHHLDLEGAFDEPTAMFYAANVLLALEFLHSKGMVYRDLKPENLLLDTQGYIKMADFGFAKFVGNDKTFTICGTPDYQAPEVIMRRGTTKAADYWALGVLIFEMLVGDPPFKSLTGDPWDTFRRTLSGRFYVPNFISDTAADLIFKLLQVNPDKRLGSDKKLGADEIKRHRWFSRMDWKALEQKKLTAPIRPRVRNPLDTSNFDNFDNCEVESPAIPPGKERMHATTWELWDWIEPPPQ